MSVQILLPYYPINTFHRINVESVGNIGVEAGAPRAERGRHVLSREFERLQFPVDGGIRGALEGGGFGRACSVLSVILIRCWSVWKISKIVGLV